MRVLRKFGENGIVFCGIFLTFFISDAIILNGGPDSYARFPKWAHSFENSLSMEIKTRQSDGMLLYTDDGATHGNFYSLTIVEGNLQLDFRLGDNSNEFGLRRPVNTIRIEEVRIDDDKWHTLTIFQSWENVKLELDYTLVFKILNQRSFVFGNILKNSDVFVGGLPQNLHMLPVMSSPLRRYSQHLAVNIRNLMYRQYPQDLQKLNIIIKSLKSVTSPQLLEAVGTRTNEDDHCKPKIISSRETFTCHNQGVCYSTNDGAQCDCSFSDHNGKTCEIEKSEGEITFGGDEWIGYDVSANISAAVRAKKENLTLTFKTVHGTSMLFYAGDEKSFLHIMLQDGAIIATSKFDGSDPRIIRMFNVFPSERYDDDAWHTIVLERSLQMHSDQMVAIHMILIVDGQRDEIRQYAPELDWISNSIAYVGSIPKQNPLKDVNRVSFRGCMKMIRYDIDATRLLFVNLADQSYGRSVVKTGGDVSYSCKNPAQRSDVLSFIETSSFLELPKWNSLSSGSMSFHFRTTSPDGLILYHGVLQNNATDYIAFEMIDNHLYLVINLGSGVVRLQTTAFRVSDGEWHHVQLDRLSRTGSVVVDAIKIDFNTPGVSSNLIIDDPIFIGNVPNNTLIYPPTIWSIALNKGFIGCIKNIRLNGVSAKISQYFDASNTTGIELGCAISNEVDVCEPNPCQNFGKCFRNLNSFTCDCSNTNFEGKRCEIEHSAVEFIGNEPNIHVLPFTRISQVEHVQIRFRTSVSRGVLFDTSANGKNDTFTIFLNESHLNLFIQDSKSNKNFSWGKILSDNHWHELQVRRLGHKLLLYLDGYWGHSIYLQNSPNIEIDEMGIGCSVHATATSPRDENFRGYLSKIIFNGRSYMIKNNKPNSLKSSSRESKGQRNIKSKISSVSFTNSTGFLKLHLHQLPPAPFRIQFKFQTLMRSANLLHTIPANPYDQSIRVEILNNRLKYTYRCFGREFHVMSKAANALNDMRWHSVIIYQDEITNQQILRVDNWTSSLRIEKIKKVGAQISGMLFIGNNPNEKTRGFRGCISSLKINDNSIDMFEEAESKFNVVKGCSGPVARCVEDACANQGRCIQLWSSIRCDCSLTAHSGDRCQNPATAVGFEGSPSMIYYEYSPNERPTSSQDFFVFSFRTTQPNGVLAAIQCSADQDYFTVFLSKGYLNAHFNLGSRDHRIGYFTKSLNDGFLHTVKISRIEANVTIQIDRLPALRYRPKRLSELVLLNMQTRISIGASFNTWHLDDTINREKRSLEIYDSYQGDISGININGLMILDLYENGSNRIFTIGSPKTIFVSKKEKSKSSEDEEFAEIMNSIDENSNEALIESLSPTCLSIEEQQSCFIETDDSSDMVFYNRRVETHSTTVSPILCLMNWDDVQCRQFKNYQPRFASNYEGPVKSVEKFEIEINDRENQESQKIGFFSPVLTTIPIPTTTTTEKGSTKITTITTTTKTPMKPSSDSPVVYLSQFESSEPDEGSGDDLFAATARTTPTTTMVSSVVSKVAGAKTSTVLPRPYASVREAAEQNPDYIGASIWSQVDALPEPMITGPAWKRVNTTRTRVTPTPYTKAYDPPAVTITTTTQPIQTPRVKTTPRFSVYPVRPTTPMGDTITSTMQAATVSDFPRTPLIMCSSLAVIVAIAAVVFFVFKCRQNPPNSEHYTMAMKPQSGYTAIAPELSPPMNHDRISDSCTQPLIAKPHINGNGYEPIKGAVIGNGASSLMRNGNGTAKKKDFKEWYV